MKRGLVCNRLLARCVFTKNKQSSQSARMFLSVFFLSLNNCAYDNFPVTCFFQILLVLAIQHVTIATIFMVYHNLGFLLAQRAFRDNSLLTLISRIIL